MRLSNLKTRTAMNVKILVFFNCVEAIRYLLLYSSHDRTLTWWISNGKFRWRMVSFQSPFKENEINLDYL